MIKNIFSLAVNIVKFVYSGGHVSVALLAAALYQEHGAFNAKATTSESVNVNVDLAQESLSVDGAPPTSLTAAEVKDAVKAFKQTGKLEFDVAIAGPLATLGKKKIRAVKPIAEVTATGANAPASFELKRDFDLKNPTMTFKGFKLTPIAIPMGAVPQGRMNLIVASSGSAYAGTIYNSFDKSNDPAQTMFGLALNGPWSVAFDTAKLKALSKIDFKLKFGVIYQD